MTSMTETPAYETLTLEPIIEQPAEPKVPPGIYLALVTGITGLLAAYGLPIPERAEDSIVQIVSALVVIIPLAEAWLRGKRNDRHASVQAARLAAPQVSSVTNVDARS